MSWFNWPPEPEVVRYVYFKVNQTKASTIDPGIALAMHIFEKSKECL